jgi:hypothetical protein
MQMTNDAEFSGDVIVHGSVIGSGDLAFSGSLNNDGTVSSLGGEAIFTGATSGSGSVVGSASYSGAATHVYGGAYDSLTVGSAAVLGGDAQVWNMNLNGSLGTADGSTLTIYGTANGNGTMTGGDGTVVYNGIAAMQRMYAGRYDNLVIGNSAVGKFNARGDIFISGDAVNRSAKAGIAVTNAAVTYDGAEAQRVMAGSYAALVLDGTGTKLMEPGVFKAGSFTAAGSPRSELTVTSDSGSERWILDARDVSMHYVDLRNADATRTIYLDGTNVTGGNISPRWEVFDSAGGIGDMFPSLANRNFRAIAFYADRLALDPAADPFAFAHRLPGSPLPIAVGESARTEPLVGAYDSYDLINFNGGDAGIRLLDEESREVLSDASAAGSSDLVELLEAK